MAFMGSGDAEAASISIDAQLEDGGLIVVRSAEPTQEAYAAAGLIGKGKKIAGILWEAGKKLLSDAKARGEAAGGIDQGSGSCNIAIDCSGGCGNITINSCTL